MSASRSPEILKEHHVTVVALGPKFENLDESDLEEVGSALLNVASNADPPLIVLDLAHTKFFGSAFIELLFRSWNRVNARPGGRFAISGLTKYCKEVIEVTHLDRLWDVYSTRDDAVQALRG